MGTDLVCELAHLEFPDPPIKERGLRPFRAPEPPHNADHAIREKLLDRPHRREICPNPVPEILEGVEVLIREHDVTGKEAVPQRVVTDGGFPFRRLWTCGVESVRPVCSNLSFARHGSRPPLILSETALDALS
jgi:hypothetical protein